MEKISGILPSSARVTNVDLKNEMPARPGSPLFGRVEGRVTARDKYSKAAAHNRLDVQTLNSHNRYQNPKDASKVRIAEKMANDFFMNNHFKIDPEIEFAEKDVENNLLLANQKITEETAPEIVDAQKERFLKSVEYLQS